MQIAIPQAGRWIRTAGVAGLTGLFTGMLFLLVLQETDLGRGLYYTYDRIYAMAVEDERQERWRSAEEHFRFLIFTEENRVLRHYGLIVNDEMLLYARLGLARTQAARGQQEDAEVTYREAQEEYGDRLTWRRAAVQVAYARFLFESGRNVDGRNALTAARRLVESMRAEGSSSWVLPWKESEYRWRDERLDHFTRQLRELASRFDVRT